MSDIGYADVLHAKGIKIGIGGVSNPDQLQSDVQQFPLAHTIQVREDGILEHQGPQHWGIVSSIHRKCILVVIKALKEGRRGGKGRVVGGGEGREGWWEEGRNGGGEGGSQHRSIYGCSHLHRSGLPCYP